MKHSYVTCDRCDERIERSEFKEVTGTVNWELCYPCYEALQAFILNDQPEAAGFLEEESTAQMGRLEEARRERGINTAIGVPTAEAEAGDASPTE